MIKLLKKWIWLPLLGFLIFIFALLTGRDKKWEKEKLSDIKDRQDRIDKLREEREKIELEPLEDFEKVVERHDEEMQQARGDVNPITDPDDIADFIKDYPSK